ncbi:MAG: BrnT family toxin [Ignavibacteriae bacterium]|nr:BrnT family toxin [Ignavibacteriota bacterium]
MKISGIIWLDEIVEKIQQKHDVLPIEVKEVINSSKHFRFVEKGFRESENVYASFGRTDAGRYLIVFFIYKKNQQALILSARDMTKAERKLYEKK